MKNKLTLVRGKPGSGKSTLANKLKDNNGIVLEADMYFINEKGEYIFKPEKLREAHEWCLNETGKHLAQGKNVYVANTFTKLWELNKYLKLAEERDKEVVIFHKQSTYESIHNVPQEVIDRMEREYEPHSLDIPVN